MDGYKSGLLIKSLKKYEEKYSSNDFFIVIGHPKATTPYSLDKLDRFLEKNKESHEFTTYRCEL